MTVIQVDLPRHGKPDPDAVSGALTAASLPADDVRVNGRALYVLYRRDLTDGETNTARSVAVEQVFNPPAPLTPEPASDQRVADMETVLAALTARVVALETISPPRPGP